jgi:hypothetical protein
VNGRAFLFRTSFLGSPDRSRTEFDLWRHVETGEDVEQVGWANGQIQANLFDMTG